MPSKHWRRMQRRSPPDAPLSVPKHTPNEHRFLNASRPALKSAGSADCRRGLVQFRRRLRPDDQRCILSIRDQTAARSLPHGRHGDELRRHRIGLRGQRLPLTRPATPDHEPRFDPNVSHVVLGLSRDRIRACR